MNRMKKYILGILTAIMVCFLTGCSAGSTVNTDEFINADGSGSRCFSVVINQEVFNQYFSGEPGELYVLIQDNCPAELSFTYSEDDGEWVYSFTLNYNSLGDYIEKASILTGVEQNISLEVAETVWTNGFYLDESFTSIDLLGWLRTAVVENGYISEDNANNIFGDGETHLIFNGETYSTGSTINVNQVNEISIAQVDVVTDILDLDSYNRKVSFSIDPYYLQNGESEKIEDFFASTLQSGMKFEVEDQDYYTTYVVSQEKMSVDQLKKFDQALFGAENVEFDTIDVKVNSTPFQFGTEINETLQLSNYLIGENNTSIYMYYSLPNGYEFLTSGDGEYYYHKDVYNTEPFMDTSIYGKYAASHIHVLKDIEVPAIDVNVSKAFLNNDMTVKHTISLGKNVTAEEITEIAEHFKNIASNQDVTVEKTEGMEFAPTVIDCDVQVEVATAEDGTSQIVITQSGDVNSISESLKKIYGSSYAGLGYSKTGSFWNPMKKEAYSYSVSYNEFLPSSNFNTKTTVSFDLGSINIPSADSSIDKDSYTMEGGVFTREFTRRDVDVIYYGSLVDWFGVGFWVCVVLGLLFILLAVLKAFVFKKGKAEKQPKQPKQPKNKQQAQQTQQAVQPMENQPAAPVNDPFAQPLPVSDEQQTEAPVQNMEEAPGVNEAPEFMQVEPEIMAEEPEIQTPVEQMVPEEAEIPAPVVVPEIQEEATGLLEEPVKETEKAMFCPNCGTKLTEDTIFCGNCGTKVQ